VKVQKPNIALEEIDNKRERKKEKRRKSPVRSQQA
jgi:hypothetical protein